jgi:molecular chaperone DnaK
LGVENNVVGIDLGTTRSVVAHIDKFGNPCAIANSEGDLTTPSAVLFENGTVAVGKEALKARAAMPDQVAMFAKREMGKEKFSTKLDGKEYPPELIQSFILGKLRDDAEAKLGQPVKGAVITVPAHFNEPKRRATLDAAKLAGIEVLAIINEPTASAIAYGLETHFKLLGPQTALVYDLGGGTFDTSIVHVAGSNVEVRGCDGNAMLGGIDWDKCLIAWLDEQFQKECRLSPLETTSGRAMLAAEAQDLKHTLSARKSSNIRIVYRGKTLSGKLSREQFEEMTAHLLDRTRFTVRQLLQNSNLTWDKIDQVILVGGSTRMPQVKAMLMKDSGMEPNLTVSAEEAIAHGAAIYASQIVTKKMESDSPSSLSIQEVTAHNLCVLGVENSTGLKRNHVMIKQNSPIPVEQRSQFVTRRDNQPSVVVEVVEGGDIRGRHGTIIGRCVLRNLPPKTPAGAPVDVRFRYDQNGLIFVKAEFPTTGQSKEIKIDRYFGQDDAQMDELREIHLALGLQD